MKKLLILFIVTLAFQVAAAAQKQKALTPYRVLVVEEFSVADSPETRDLPQSYPGLLRAMAIERLRRAHLFDDVREAPAGESCKNCLLLSAQVVHYGKGSRAARFWIGMGAGRAKVVTVFSFREPESGKEVLRLKLEGKHYGWVSGQQEAAVESLGDVVDRLIDHSRKNK